MTDSRCSSIALGLNCDSPHGHGGAHHAREITRVERGNGKVYTLHQDLTWGTDEERQLTPRQMLEEMARLNRAAPAQ